MELKLVRPTLEMKEKYFDFIKEWDDLDEDIIPSAVKLEGRNYEEWLKRTIDFESTPIDGLIPAHTYFLIDKDENIIGAINIRHYLNDYLEKFAGHIGYGIKPSERKKGYGSEILSMGVKLADELGIDDLLLVCRKDNIGYAKVIQQNGGVLENEILNNENLMQRYWINTTSNSNIFNKI